jgi:hypothetical protein
MKTLSRTLAMIVSLQLAVGCEHFGYIANRALPGSDLFEISGSIARSISNSIIPSAVAADGTISVYDASMPDAQVEIFSKKLSGSDDYFIQIDKSLVQGRLIKIKFISNEGDEKNRDLLILTSDNGASLNGSLDEDSSIRSLILEHQLKVELGRGEIVSLKHVKDRYAGLKNAGIDDEMELLGDKVALMKMFHSADFRELVAEYLAIYRLAVSQGNTEEAYNIVQKLFYYSIKAGVMKDGILKCAEDKNSAKLMIADSDNSYNFFARGNDQEVINAFGEEADFGSASDSGKSNEILENILGKLGEISKSAGKNLSIELIVVANDKSEQRCTLYGQPKTGDDEKLSYKEIDFSILYSVEFEKFGKIEEGQEQLYHAYKVTLDDLNKRMEAADVEPKEAEMIMNDQIPAAKKLYESRLKELEKYFNPVLSLDEIDYRILNNVSFVEIGSFEEGQALLGKAYEVTIEDLKKRLEAAKLDPKEADAILENQIPVAKALFDSRLKDLHLSLNQAKEMEKK